MDDGQKKSLDNSDSKQDPSTNSPIIKRPIILGDLTLGNPTTFTTIGSNGSATALTANPVGYIVFNIGNASYQLPFYNLA